jgi:hypothetical protein
MKEILSAIRKNVQLRIQDALEKEKAAGQAWVLAAILLLSCLAVASQRPFWFDEFMTFYIARAGGFHQMAAAVKSGADTIPPYFHYVQSMMLMSGLPEEIALRFLPALGVAAGFLCLYYFLLPKCGHFGALAGAMVPVSGDAMRFGWEARPYGILFGLSAAAALAWRQTERRQSWAAVLCLFLAAATFVHPFAIFVTGAIAAAEAFLSFREGRFRVGVWLALALASLAELFQFSFLFHARKNFAATFFASAGWSAFEKAFRELFSDLWPVIVWVALWLGLSALAKSSFRASSHESPVEPPDTPKPLSEFRREAVLGVALLAILPLATLFVFRTLGGGIVARYILPAMIGAGILWGIGLTRAGRTQCLVVLACLLIIVGLRIYPQAKSYLKSGPIWRGSRQTDPILRHISGAEVNSIVISSAEAFIRLWRHASPTERNRIVFISDPTIAVKIANTDSVDKTMMGFRRLTGARILNYRPFIERNPDFHLVVGRSSSFEWILPWLVREGCTLILSSQEGAYSIYKVSCSDGRGFGAL